MTIVLTGLVLSACAGGDDTTVEDSSAVVLQSASELQEQGEQNSVYIASPEVVETAVVVEVDLPPDFPRDVPLSAYGTLIAANAYPGRTFTATWRIEDGNADIAQSYVGQWEALGFSVEDSDDISGEANRILTYRLVRPDMKVGISTTIPQGPGDSLLAIAGSWK